MSLSFESAEALIYDPVSANRAATRASLYALGFRRIEAVASLETFAAAMREQPPDLALCELQGTASPLCKLIQDFRLGNEGANPFVVIIATAWENSDDMVKSVVDSGADDLLLRPFSVAQLG